MDRQRRSLIWRTEHEEPGQSWELPTVLAVGEIIGRWLLLADGAPIRWAYAVTFATGWVSADGTIVPVALARARGRSAIAVGGWPIFTTAEGRATVRDIPQVIRVEVPVTVERLVRAVDTEAEDLALLFGDLSLEDEP